MKARIGLGLFLSGFGLACRPAAVPAVSIETPAEGTRVSGRVTLAATAQPVTGVEQVDFVVDAQPVGSASAPPFSVSWDSSTFAGRQVSLTAEARTTSGAVAISTPIRLTVDPPSDPLPNGPESIYRILNEGSLKLANELLQDVWDLGARSTPVYLNPITWTEDPYNDKYWRFLFYSLRPTANLLWAYYTVHDPIYRDKLVQILRSYVAYDRVRPDDDDPQKLTFEEDYTLAFRAMVLVNTYVKLKRSSDLPADLDSDLVVSINKLGARLTLPGGFTGDFGNHGFTSAAAQVLISKNFPMLPDAAFWNRLGYDRLNQLIVNAVDVDGVEIENSPFYHLYVMTFTWEIVKWARLWGEVLPTEFASRTEMMADYVAYIIQPDGDIPLLGSSVESGLTHMDSALTADLIAAHPNFAYIASQGAAGNEPSKRSRLFPTSGQSILRSGFGPPADFAKQTFITFNVGPWRTPHNHLDVLGITYYSGGRVLLPDSGLFTYTFDSNRAYFFGTRAHNTVVVDGQDQSKGQVVLAGLTASGPTWAYQSGSDGLNCGVTHRRGVLLLQRDLTLVVDRLTSAPAACWSPFPPPLSRAPHEYSQTWHFAPDLGIELSGLDATATDESGAPALSLVQGVAANVGVRQLFGSNDPIQGWYSEKYGIKVPNPVLEYWQTGDAASFATLLASGPFAGTQPQLTIDQNDDSEVRVRVCAGEVQYQVEIDDLVGPNEAVQVNPSTSGCN